MSLLQLDALTPHLAAAPRIRREGRVVQVVGTVIEAELPGVAVGELAEIGRTTTEVIGFREHRALLMPLGPIDGVACGSTARVRSSQLSLAVGPGLLGRVIDPLGAPMDGRPLTDVPFRRPLNAGAPDPMKRSRIDRSLPTGIRVIDGLLTLGCGQRIAVMAGSGVGKSTLLGMFAKNSKATVNVVALIGERGREVREFLERDLGEEGLARSVVVLATSDASPVVQVKALSAALAVAEHFRDEGEDVLLMVDSLTRLAMAQRQVGLSAGEPPTTKGYTPSVFSLMPRLLERAGPGAGRGSITGVFTVLVEGDDMDDPVADTVRGIVDGHVVLSRRLASFGHYPAIDVLESVSRTMPMTTSPEHVEAGRNVRAIAATYRENEELVRLGAYKVGSDPEVDASITAWPHVKAFLQQGVDEVSDWEQTITRMRQLSGLRQSPQPTRRRQTAQRGRR